MKIINSQSGVLQPMLSNEELWFRQGLSFERGLGQPQDNKKAVIQLRPDLARFLVNEDQKKKVDEILSFEEEKQNIIKLIICS